MCAATSITPAVPIAVPVHAGRKVGTWYDGSCADHCIERPGNLADPDWEFANQQRMSSRRCHGQWKAGGSPLVSIDRRQHGLVRGAVFLATHHLDGGNARLAPPGKGN